MKKTMFLETIRTIKLSLGKYLTLLFVVLLGVAFFAGVLSITNVMEESVDKYYDDKKFFDYQIYSNYGFSSEDITNFENDLENYTLEGSKFLDVEATFNQTKYVFRVEAMLNNQELNQIDLIEGRYPENDNEAIAELSSNLYDTPSIGDIVTITNATSDIDKTLSTKTFEIVGIATSPNYMSLEKGTGTYKNLPITSFLYVNEDVFISDNYTAINIKDNKASKEIDFSEEYNKIIKTNQKELETYITKKEQDKSEQMSELLNSEINVDYALINRESHYATITYKDTISQMQAIGLIFPIFFFLVAGLVCLTTMSRMVDEERGQIGILRALGYTKFLCLSKYLIYALSATAIGGIIGSIFGMLFFPQVIYNTWKMVFHLPEVYFEIPWINIILAIMLFVIVITATTIHSIRKETKRVPSELLRPKAPLTGKKIILEKISYIWKKMSFTSKITARNILRYKKRFIMTVLGIGGCTCLLVSGFGIRSSISNISNLQFNELSLYNGTISLNSLDDSQINILKSELKNIDKEIKTISLTSYSSKVKNNDQEEISYIHIYDNDLELKEMNIVRNISTHEEYNLDNNSILISYKLAELLKVEENDIITIESINGQTANVAVGGIFERYVQHEIYMTESLYYELYNEYNIDNSILFKSNIDESILKEEILSLNNVNGIMFNSDSVESFDNIISGMNIVVIVIIISAAALAFIVLGNLAVININERKREIATLKVLGFNHKETKDYIFKENMVLTFFGSLVGAVLGIFAHNFIILQVEINIMLFERIVSLDSLLYSVIITFVFSVIVNKLMLSKIKKIDMIESLKSVE